MVNAVNPYLNNDAVNGGSNTLGGKKAGLIGDVETHARDVKIDTVRFEAAGIIGDVKIHALEMFD